MGRGDVRSRKGKISNGSFGKNRPARPQNEATKPKPENALAAKAA